MYWHKDSDSPLLEFQFVNQISTVKNLAFNPRVGKIFACGHEDGKMFIWNTDIQNEPIMYFQVDGQAFEGVEWHPNNTGILMCGTKSIQVIKIQGNKYEIEQTINTLRGKLSCLKWRPNYDNQISYSSESSIIIIDRNRPYLYQYMITVENGPIHSFEWDRKDNLIIALKKDIVIVNIKDAQRPILDMNVTICDIDVNDNILYIKQEDFTRDPDRLHKLKPPNTTIAYEHYKDFIKPKYDSIIEKRANEISLGTRREYYIKNNQYEKRKRKKSDIAPYFKTSPTTEEMLTDVDLDMVSLIGKEFLLLFRLIKQNKLTCM